MRGLIVSLVSIMAISGCSGRTSSLLLERQSKGPIEESSPTIQIAQWNLNPNEQTQTNQNIEVTVIHATPEYQKDFFGRQKVFGSFAGNSPFYQEHMVFYVRISNKSDRKISINPTEFAIVDDRGNQSSPLSIDYITAFVEHKRPMSTVSRGLIENARPGYFGFSLPIGRMITSRPQGHFALIQRSAMQSGYLHPGVIHDGLVAYWSPVLDAKVLKLLITNIKTDFDANDYPQTSLEFAFEFAATAE